MFRSVPFKLAGIYLLLGGLWIVLSDRLLYLTGASPEQITRLQTLKGWIFIILSAALMFALARYYLASLEAARGALSRSEARFQGFMNHAPAITFIKDPTTGQYLFVNQRAAVLHQANIELFAGRTDAEVFPPDEVRLLRETAETALRENRPVEVTLRCRGGTGAPTDWLLIEFPLADGGRRLVGGVAVDITDRVRAEEQLRQAKELAEGYSRAKDQFLSVLSHELRTPLTPALLTASALERDASLPADAREDIGMIRQQVELESRLIDDLLDVTRINTGRLEVRPKMTDVHALLRHTARMFQTEAGDKDLRFEWHLDAPDHHALVDPDRLRQCFWNLLGNSVKFTPAGGTVSIATRNEPGSNETGDHPHANGGPRATAGDRRQMLVIDVTDTGIGIDPAVIPRLFNAFEQADQTLTRQFGGLGLGLSICKAIVDLHGGHITGSSAGPGQGATFTLRLPVIAAPAPSPAPTAPPSPPPAPAPPPQPTAASEAKPPAHRILVVEDEPITQNVLARLLRALGHSVSTASSVAQGARAADEQEFDVLISDIGLPDGSGWDLLRQMGTRRPRRAIAVSGYGGEADLRSSREAGFDAHLTKPIDLPQLKQALTDLAPQFDGETPQATRAT